MYNPVDGLIACLILSMLIALPLSFALFFVMALAWDLCGKKTAEVATKQDYPVVGKLLSLGWQWKMPKAKYGERKNETIDKHTIAQLNIEHQQEAKEVIMDFLLWCESKDSGNRAPPTVRKRPWCPTNSEDRTTMQGE
jgi:hypothetical protein